MRPWLEMQINSNQIPGLTWINKVSGYLGVFGEFAHFNLSSLGDHSFRYTFRKGSGRGQAGMFSLWIRHTQDVLDGPQHPLAPLQLKGIEKVLHLRALSEPQSF